MAEVATTRMSSKGQIVIPEDIRKKLRLKEGSRFMVLGEKDVVILKNITSPSLDEFDTLIKTARRQAKEAGLKISDVRKIISQARDSK
ncbi:MAG TPA: AbrB/MazE/SpoVT family DNA-binding domain-containing protein [Deltaproteobacteria bacterium]|nr:AbrB/MazE/SpoVT family DNA-binding domain-containing protein [Deltaproteobacteria bacterium]